METKRIAAAAALLLIAGLMLGANACGGGEAADPTPVTAFKITPAAGARTAPPTAVATKPAATPAAGGGTLTITALNSLFEKTELTASPGPLEITFDNKDAGVPHNLHLYQGSSASGKDLGTTDINVGPVADKLDVTLEPGAYYFQCDVHVTTMKGTLTVK